jgi:hypothetical protein
VALLIRNSTGRSRVFDLTAWLLYFHRYPLSRRLGLPHSKSELAGETERERQMVSPSRILIPDCPLRSIVTVLTTLLCQWDEYIKIDVILMGWCARDVSASWLGPMVSFYAQGNEPSGSIKYMEFLY